MQKFLDENPLLGGILVFLAIAIITVAVTLVILFVLKKNKNKKTDKNKQHQEEIIQEEQIEKPEKVEEIDNSIYFVLDFGNSGNLIMKNINDDFIYEKPTKDDFLNVLKNDEYKLVLPEGKVRIQFNSENDQSVKYSFVLSQEIKDKNLFVYKMFLKMMRKYDSPWAISKFV